MRFLLAASPARKYATNTEFDKNTRLFQTSIGGTGRPQPWYLAFFEASGKSSTVKMSWNSDHIDGAQHSHGRGFHALTEPVYEEPPILIVDCARYLAAGGVAEQMLASARPRGFRGFCDSRNCRGRCRETGPRVLECCTTGHGKLFCSPRSPTAHARTRGQR
jgi:hypothetical protein